MDTFENWFNAIPIGVILAAIAFIFGIFVLYKKIHKEVTESTSGWFKNVMTKVMDDDQIKKKIADSVPSTDEITKQVGKISSQLDNITENQTKLFKSQEELNTKVKDLMNSFGDEKKEIDNLALETRINFIIRCLSDIEQGKELKQIELERFHEAYSKIAEAEDNNYIKMRVDKLMKEGKL